MPDRRTEVTVCENAETLMQNQMKAVARMEGTQGGDSGRMNAVMEVAKGLALGTRARQLLADLHSRDDALVKPKAREGTPSARSGLPVLPVVFFP